MPLLTLSFGPSSSLQPEGLLIPYLLILNRREIPYLSFVFGAWRAHDELGESAEAEHFLKRAILSDTWRSVKLAKLIELFVGQRYGELVIYTRDRLDQLAIEETPTATLEVCGGYGQKSAVKQRSSSLTQLGLETSVMGTGRPLIENSSRTNAKTQVVRHLESRFSESEISTHRGMLSAGELYEFEFSNESLAVKTYQVVLMPIRRTSMHLRSSNPLGAAFTVATAWRRLPGVKQLEVRGERRRAMYLAKQTVELAQHALRENTTWDSSRKVSFAFWYTR